MVKLIGENRKAMAQVISEMIGEQAVYKKVPSCAYQIGAFTISKDATLTWAEDTDQETIKGVIAGLQMLGFTAVTELQLPKKKTTAHKEAQLETITEADHLEYDRGRYYINNRKVHVEVYVPGTTNRFLTMTGKCIHGNAIEECSEELKTVLEKYMVRPQADKHEKRQEVLSSQLGENAGKDCRYFDAMIVMVNYYLRKNVPILTKLSQQGIL